MTPCVTFLYNTCNGNQTVLMSTPLPHSLGLLIPYGAMLMMLTLRVLSMILWELFLPLFFIGTSSCRQLCCLVLIVLF